MIILNRRLNYDVFEAIRIAAIGLSYVPIELYGTILSNYWIMELSIHDTPADDDLLEIQIKDQVLAVCRQVVPKSAPHFVIISNLIETG